MPIPENVQRFGHRLRVHRQRAGLTLQELSNQTGIALSMISQFEHARRFPGEDHVVVLARALKLSPSERHTLLYAGALEQLTPGYRAALLAGPISAASDTGKAEPSP
jgi:transcriptional regulator with XRE-family HTH domain